MFRKLIRWLASLFASDTGSTADTYHPKQRLLYSYWNGEKLLHVDPLPLYKRLMAEGTELDIELKGANSPGKWAVKSHTDAVARIREIFSVKEWEKGGLTESEVMELLDHFLSYTDGVKKNSSQTPTSAETTSPSTASISAESSPTPNTAASTSTEKEPLTEVPQPLQTE